MTDSFGDILNCIVLHQYTTATNIWGEHFFSQHWICWDCGTKLEKSPRWAEANTPPKSAEQAYAVAGQTTTEAGQTGNLTLPRERKLTLDFFAWKGPLHNRELRSYTQVSKHIFYS